MLIKLSEYRFIDPTEIYYICKSDETCEPEWFVYFKFDPTIRISLTNEEVKILIDKYIEPYKTRMIPL